MHLNIGNKFLIKIMILSSIILIFTNAFSINSTIENQINTIILDHDSNANVKMSIDQNKIENRFSFVLFYMSTCPHCQRFDPILKTFSTENHIPVLAYTINGNVLPSFPNSFTPTKKEIQKFFPMGNPVVPTLFLMDQKTHRIYPVMRGEATQDQLSRRFGEIQNKILNGSVNVNNEQDFNS